MESISPQVMHKLVFTILVHGLPDSQTGLAMEVLTEALASPNGQVRELAIVAVAEVPVAPVRRVSLLAGALKDPFARVRRRAARALGDFGVNALPTLPALVAGLKDPDPSVRRDCAGTLGRFGPAASAAAPGLVTLLGEVDTRTRVVTAAALKRIGRAALPALMQGLAHRNSELRGRCATLLGQMAPGDPVVNAALRSVALDGDEEVRRRASEALTQTPMPVSILVPIRTTILSTEC